MSPPQLLLGLIFLLVAHTSNAGFTRGDSSKAVLPIFSGVPPLAETPTTVSSNATELTAIPFDDEGDTDERRRLGEGSVGSTFEKYCSVQQSQNRGE